MDRAGLVHFCEQAYARFHHPRYVSPDPLEVVREFGSLPDREVVGLLASSLALGRVAGILGAVRSVVRRLRAIDSSPAVAVAGASDRELRGASEGFAYRFFDSEQLLGLLCGIRFVLARYGSLEACAATGVCSSTADEPLVRGLSALVEAIRGGASGRLDESILLADPSRGSACKRLLLYARWMVRRDEIDPGGWRVVGPESLLVPVDTHVLRVGRALGLTGRTVASLAVSREITAGLRVVAPEDPVKYDFALTRPGIHPLLDEQRWLVENGCTQSA